MSAIRRVYLYLVALASLGMLASGLIGLADALLDLATDASAGGLRGEITLNGAYVIVGLPVWLLHWLLAQRAARADPAERAATLRRLFLYAVLLVAIVTAANALQALLEALLGRAAGTLPAARAARQLLDPLPRLLVTGAFWLYYRAVAIADRAAAGEEGGGATLRRWYVYGAAFIGLMVLLWHAGDLLRVAWEAAAAAITGTVATSSAGLATGMAATTLAALGLWLLHWSGAAAGPSPTRLPSPAGPSSTTAPNPDGRPPASAPHNAPEQSPASIPNNAPGQTRSQIATQDTRSVLRPVYLFLALGVSVAVTLAAAARVLYFLLATALGVDRPGGVGEGVLLAMAGPVASAVVYGAGWLHARQALARQAALQPELPRQAGVRRLYVYLVSLVALSVLAAGAGGLLWTVADLSTNAPHTVNPDDWWRRQFSLYATLLVVGLPVWAWQWGRLAGTADVAERGSLSRRLYLYATLLAGALALLGAGAVAAKQLLDLLLGEAATPSVVTNLARALSVAAVAALIAFYHLRVLRRDVAAVRAAHPPSASSPAAALPPSPDRPFGVLTRRGRTEHTTWFPTRAEAAAALAALDPQDADWSTLIRLDDPPKEDD